MGKDIRVSNYILFNCSNLSSLPDISKWNTSNVTNMGCFFYCCESLLFLPNISKWNTSNVTNMSGMFSECKSLSFLPDISKWNTSNNTNMTSMFSGCISLLSLHDLSKENILMEEAIEVVMDEGKCSRPSAIKALRLNNGDVVEALLDIGYI